LASYRGPVTTAEAAAGYTAQLLDAQAYRFTRFVAPKYPPLAMNARIDGSVELRLTIEPKTGEVLNVEAISGHPLPKPSAIEAATQWLFQPDSTQNRKVTVTLNFALHCP
jgi:TonB family protein